MLKRSIISYCCSQWKFIPVVSPPVGPELTLDPPCDVQELVLVVFPQISRVQPAVLVQSLGRFVRHVQVAHEDVPTPETDLSVPLLVGVLQLRLAARHHLSTAAEREV